MPSAQPARPSSSGSRSYSTQSTHSTFAGALAQERLELAAADDAERDLRREPRRREDRLEPVQRDQLADEERVERGRAAASPGGRPAPRRRRSTPRRRRAAARRARRGSARSARCRRRRGRRAGARGGRSRAGARAAGEPGAKRPRSSTSVSSSDTSGLKTTGRAARGALRRRAGRRGPDSRRSPRRSARAAAEQRAAPPPGQPRRGARAGRPVVPPPLPDADVPLDHLDAGAAQARDHLRVARVVALVRPEVEDPQAQRRISSTCSSARPAAPSRSSWWLVISSLRRPSETSCTPTTTSRTPSVSSGRWPIASPAIFSTVR